jgi:hypothetical protein
VVLSPAHYRRFRICLSDLERDVEKGVVGRAYTEGAMHCLRCQGLMIEVDMREVSSQDSVLGWRCLLCGETTDSGIEANRMSHGQPSRTRARVPGSPPARTAKGSVR